MQEMSQTGDNSIFANRKGRDEKESLEANKTFQRNQTFTHLVRSALFHAHSDRGRGRGRGLPMTDYYLLDSWCHAADLRSIGFTVLFRYRTACGLAMNIQITIPDLESMGKEYFRVHCSNISGEID